MDILLDILTRDQQGWVALAIAMAAIGFVLYRNRFRKKADPLGKPAFGSLAQERSVERQMQSLLVELSDMTRQMNAQIDTRAAKLEHLIREADQRIDALRQASGEAPQRHSFDEPPPARPIKPIPVIPVRSPEEPAAEVDPRHADIYTLADEGQDARQIAMQLNRPAGEVELILALRQRV